MYCLHGCSFHHTSPLTTPLSFFFFFFLLQSINAFLTNKHQQSNKSKVSLNHHISFPFRKPSQIHNYIKIIIIIKPKSKPRNQNSLIFIHYADNATEGRDTDPRAVPKRRSTRSFLAWISLVPVFISLDGFISHFIFRRELQGICFALGLIISQFVNELIKTSVQQARPETCALLEMCNSHGWPSSHSH
jgi:hypothetical protein